MKLCGFRHTTTMQHMDPASAQAAPNPAPPGTDAAPSSGIPYAVVGGLEDNCRAASSTDQAAIDSQTVGVQDREIVQRPAVGEQLSYFVQHAGNGGAVMPSGPVGSGTRDVPEVAQTGVARSAVLSVQLERTEARATRLYRDLKSSRTRQSNVGVLFELHALCSRLTLSHAA